MTVHYTGGGGGFLGTLGKIAALGANFIPGLQPIAPFLNAAGALANGDPAGAAMSIAAGPVMDSIKGGAQAAKAANAKSLAGTLSNIAGNEAASPEIFADFGAVMGNPRLTGTPAQYRRFVNQWNVRRN
jgi:hypothetical protein